MRYNAIMSAGLSLKVSDLNHLAQLSSLSLTDVEAKKLANQFSATIKVVNKLNELDTHDIPATPQVTSLANCYREDQVDLTRCLPQTKVLSLAPKSFKGYVLVPSVFNST